MNSQKDDQELIRDFLSGDEKSFNLLAKRYQERIYWHARRMLGDHDDANEIVQQVLMVMYKKLNMFNFNSAVYTWIYRITATRSLNLLKKRNLKKILLFSTDDSFENHGYTDIIENIETRETFSKMEKHLLELPVRQREVFVLRNFDDLTYEEISGITGRSVGALKANYFHAFRKMKELMEKNG